MRRLAVTVLAFQVGLLALASAAVATVDGGQGLYGEANDKVVTNAGYILIAAIPLFVATMSFIQWRLEKRKEARKAAAKARGARPEWHGGW
jgi:hypothetical protein